MEKNDSFMNDDQLLIDLNVGKCQGFKTLFMNLAWRVIYSNRLMKLLFPLMNLRY